MLSGLLLSFVKDTYAGPGPRDDTADDDECEQTSLQIQTNRVGEIISMHQIHHYWYRGPGLARMSFYDFCCFVRLEVQAKMGCVPCEKLSLPRMCSIKRPDPHPPDSIRQLVFILLHSRLIMAHVNCDLPGVYLVLREFARHK